jgi:colicin import membrane protein
LPSYSLPRVEVKPEPKPVEREPEPVIQKPEIVIKAPEPPPKKEREQPKAPPKERVEPPPDDIRKQAERELQRDLTKDAMAREDRAGIAARAGAEAAQRGTQEWGNAIRSRAYSRMRDYEGAGVKGTAVIEVTVLPSYEVLSVRLVSSSGNAEFDADAERAVRAISPLPRPKDEASFQRVLKLNFRARN